MNNAGGLAARSLPNMRVIDKLLDAHTCAALSFIIYMKHHFALHYFLLPI
jgi:hypothetical protein